MQKGGSKEMPFFFDILLFKILCYTFIIKINRSFGVHEMADLILKKKFSLFIITVLLGVIVVLVPLSIKFTIGSSITESLADVNNNVKTLYEMEIDQIKGSAIAGCKKFSEYDNAEELFPAMDKSSQNTEAIRRALLYPESKTLLVQLDPQKVKLFESYFSGGNIN